MDAHLTHAHVESSGGRLGGGGAMKVYTIADLMFHRISAMV